MSDPAFAREPVAYNSHRGALAYVSAEEADCEWIHAVDSFEVDGIVYNRGATGGRTPSMMISFKEAPDSDECRCYHGAWFYEDDYDDDELEDLEYI